MADHFVEAAVREQIKIRHARMDDRYRLLEDLKNWYDMDAPHELFDGTIAELDKLRGEVLLLDNILRDAKEMEREANER